MPYTVSTPVFEGPFDLLLHLITRDQVDLWEVSISSIVDAYVSTLEAMAATLDLESATEFLLIAAVLLELKAHRLLPDREDADLDEELGLWEERDLLLARLLESKTFKDAAAAMVRMMDNAARSWPRAVGLEDHLLTLAPDPLAGVTPEKLRAALARVLEPRPVPRVAMDHVHVVRVTVAEAAADLAGRLPSIGRTTFTRLTSGIGERIEVIVHFLALLELYKQGMVDLEQARTFGELTVVWTGEGVGTPLAVEEYAG